MRFLYLSLCIQQTTEYLLGESLGELDFEGFQIWDESFTEKNLSEKGLFRKLFM